MQLAKLIIVMTELLFSLIRYKFNLQQKRNKLDQLQINLFFPIDSVKDMNNFNILEELIGKYLLFNKDKLQNKYCKIYIVSVKLFIL